MALVLHQPPAKGKLQPAAEAFWQQPEKNFNMDIHSMVA
jgi:hypothetical protein